MEIDQNTVFRLASPEPDKNKKFGTGFAVACKDKRLFILTCAHVVKDLNDHVKVIGQEIDQADIVKIGAIDAIDLALLSIPWDDPPPPLQNCISKKDEGDKIQLRGFSLVNKNYGLRRIKGHLGQSAPRQSSDGDYIPTWDLHITDDDFCQLKGGYSGSPLCDENGRLIGVVSERVANGKYGYAVDISNLKTIYPEIAELLPSFSDLNVDIPDIESRIKQAMRELSVRADDIFSVMPNIGWEFDRMKREGIASEDEEIFGKIEEFTDRIIAAEDFIRFFKELGSREETVAGPDYGKLADRLRRGRVVLCLGQELSHLLGAAVPSTAQLIDSLVRQEGFHGPLSELCEQEELCPECGRSELVDKIRALLGPEGIGPVALYELLAGLEKPLLIISAAYDDLLERTLRNRRKVVVIYLNIRDKRCLLRYSDRQGLSACTSEDLSHQELLAHGYTVIYKLRGGFIDHERETLLLSERDYLNFNRSLQHQFPDYIRTKLQNHSLWFLGHHPESWEERLLVKSLQAQRDRRIRSLAVQKDISPFARAFWKDSHVQSFDLALKKFVQELAKAVS